MTWVILSIKNDMSQAASTVWTHSVHEEIDLIGLHTCDPVGLSKKGCCSCWERHLMERSAQLGIAWGAGHSEGEAKGPWSDKKLDWKQILTLVCSAS